jgi:ubiquinone biosynthesis protein UbiJ
MIYYRIYIRSQQEISLLENLQADSEAHPTSYAILPGIKRLGLKLTTGLHREPRLRMSGDISVLSAFVA